MTNRDLRCPRCRTSRLLREIRDGVRWSCPECHGYTSTIGALRERAPKNAVNAVWQAAWEDSAPSELTCPGCARPMARVPVPAGEGTRDVDVCRSCQLVWFDADERALIPDREPAPTRAPPTSRDARVILARAELDAIARREEERAWIPGPPDGTGKLFAASVYLPIEYDEPERHETPWVTWTLAAAITITSGAAFFALESAVSRFGFVPREIYTAGGLATIVTACFVHANLVHLLANVYFLVVFGDDVESRLGALRYLALLLLASLGAAVAWVAAHPLRVVPVIGAGGAISGIIVFYALARPMARLGIFPLPHVRIPALAGAVIWVALQIAGALGADGGAGGIAYVAHLGGAIVGLIAWIVWKDRGTTSRLPDRPRR